MKARLLFIALLFTIWLFGGIAIAAAQDTPAVTETITATVAPTATVEITAEPPITVPQQPGGTLIVGWNAFSSFFGIIVALMAGGFAFSLGTIIVVIRMVRQNDNIKDALQKIYMSQPVELRQKEKQIVQLGQELVGLGADVTSIDSLSSNIQQAAKNSLP